MAKFSIPSKQAILAGLGITALATGLVMAVLHGQKKKQKALKARKKN